MEFSTNPEFLKDLYSTEVYSIQEKKADVIPSKEQNSEESRPTAKDEETPSTVQEPAPTWVGDGSSGVALLFYKAPSDEEKQLLEKILSSIKVSLPTTLQFVELPKDLDQLLEAKNIRCTISFGVHRKVENGTFIHTKSLSELQQSVPDKKALWQSLKENF